MPIFMALILLGIALHLTPSNFINLAWYALVALTAVYAFATLMVVKESERMRLDAVRPSLSLEPGLFLEGGGFVLLYLRNSGGVAKEVKVDIEISSPSEQKALFIPAINREHTVLLLNVAKIQETGGFVKASVAYKDSYNQNLSETLSINFSELKREGRDVEGQYSELNEIHRTLERIERKLPRER